LAKIEDLKECLWRTDERLPEVRLTQIIQDFFSSLCLDRKRAIAWERGWVSRERC